MGPGGAGRAGPRGSSEHRQLRRAALPGSAAGRVGPHDLAWVDAWECLFFFDHFWDLVNQNPHGGLIIMRYLMTYPEGEAILKYLAGFARSHPGELEMVNLLEPHKLTQNSITVLRRTSGGQDRRHANTGGQISYDETLREEARRQAAQLAP